MYSLLTSKMDKLKISNLSIFLTLLVFLFMTTFTDVHASCISNVNCGTKYVSSNDSPSIVISRDVFSTGSKVDILIHAPDFNSNSYAIDTIGEEGSKVIISTREGSIQYRLVETGFDTGDFAGYVILSSGVSDCSSICGPTDGYLPASGDDAITVSFVYPDGSTISKTLSGSSQTSHDAIPEFQFVNIVLLISVISVIFLLRLKNNL